MGACPGFNGIRFVCFSGAPFGEHEMLVAQAGARHVARLTEAAGRLARDDEAALVSAFDRAWYRGLRAQAMFEPPVTRSAIVVALVRATS